MAARRRRTHVDTYEKEAICLYPLVVEEVKDPVTLTEPIESNAGPRCKIISTKSLIVHHFKPMGCVSAWCEARCANPITTRNIVCSSPHTQGMGQNGGSLTE